MKTTDYRRVRWLPEAPPCVRTFRARNNSSSSKCCSNSCPWLWFREIAQKWLLELASIANVSNKCLKKWRGPMSKAHFLWSDTPWAKARRIRPFALCFRRPFRFAFWCFPRYVGELQNERQTWTWTKTWEMSETKRRHLQKPFCWILTTSKVEIKFTRCFWRHHVIFLRKVSLNKRSLKQFHPIG